MTINIYYPNASKYRNQQFLFSYENRDGKCSFCCMFGSSVWDAHTFSGLFLRTPGRQISANIWDQHVLHSTQREPMCYQTNWQTVPTMSSGDHMVWDQDETMNENISTCLDIEVEHPKENIPSPTHKWAQEDELMIEIKHDILNTYLSGQEPLQDHTIQEKPLRAGTRYGIIEGYLLDSLTFRVTALKELYAFDKSDFTCIEEFDKDTLPKILQNTKETKNNIIGWFVANEGDNIAIPPSVLTSFASFASTNDTNDITALFLVIDLPKSLYCPKYPCAEFYDLRVASSLDCDFAQAAVAFTLESQELEKPSQIK